MGTEYYILDRERGEAFELGKSLGMYNLEQELELYLTDEKEFKELAVKEMMESHPYWDVEGCIRLAEEIWKFCDGRTGLRFVSEHFMFDGYLEYCECRLAGTRYNDKGRLVETSERWAKNRTRRMARETPEHFREMAAYYKAVATY